MIYTTRFGSKKDVVRLASTWDGPEFDSIRLVEDIVPDALLSFLTIFVETLTRLCSTRGSDLFISTLLGVGRCSSRLELTWCAARFGS